jgi:hypothetical protein
MSITCRVQEERRPTCLLHGRASGIRPAADEKSSRRGALFMANLLSGDTIL